MADWKEQARSSTTYATTQEAEPVTFKTLFDAEQHFKKTYLPQLVKTGTTLECSGHASRVTADRHVAGAARAAWEAEGRFPQQLVSALGPYFNEAGLTFFKHRKRMLFVCATKPQRHPMGQVFSDGISSILGTVELSLRIKRPQLATKILGEPQDTPEFTARKAQLASDLHYLLHAGHVIEFSDGSLELPLDPKARPEPEPKPARRSAPGEKAAATDGGTRAAPEDSAPPEEPALEIPGEVMATESSTPELVSAAPEAPAEEPPAAPAP